MPAYNRAELSAELKVVPSPSVERPPGEQVAAAMEAAGATGLAHEASPETTVLAGGRGEVLAAVTKVMEAALDAGAHEVRVIVEAERDAAHFGEPGGRRGSR
jgi:uncharacterized protein YqgV (UPF0045/DUF77 family)